MTELLLRVNGIQPAFGIEFGLAGLRADVERRSLPAARLRTHVCVTVLKWACAGYLP